jgi:hypothetical protein
MTSNKVFILCIVGMYAFLVAIDEIGISLLHYTPFLVNIIKTLFLILVGALVMTITLPKNVFTIFLMCYILLWMCYLIVKFLLPVFWPKNITEGAFSSAKLLLYYTKITQILTPLPFLLFWLLYRIYPSLTTNSAEKQQK